MEPAWLYESTPHGVRALDLGASADGDALEAAYARMPHGVYEGLRTYDGDRLFALDRHLARAARGTRDRGLPTWDASQVRAALDAVIRAHPGDHKVRIDFLDAPAEQLGSTSTVLIGLRPLTLPSEAVYRDGVGVQPLRDLEREDPDVKGAAYASRRHAHTWETRDNYEPILTSGAGELLEGVMSNFMVFRAGVLRTAGPGVLPGITRQVVLELVAERGWPIEELPVTIDEVGDLDEACLTSSVRGIVPVVRIADRPVGNERPGERVLELRRALQERCESEARPPLS